MVLEKVAIIIDFQQEKLHQKSLIKVFDTEIEKWYSIPYDQDESSPPIFSGTFPIIFSNEYLYLFGGSFCTYFRNILD